MRPPTTTFPGAHRLLLLNCSAGATSAAAARARAVAVAGTALRLSTKTTTAAAAPQKLAAAATVTATTTTASALLRQLPHLTPTPTPTAAAAARLRLFTTAAGTSAPQPTSPQPPHHPHAPAPGDASSHFKLRRDAVATAAAAPPVVDDVPAKEDYMLFHPVYTPAELTSVEETHRALDGPRSSVAFSLVTVVRFLFDKTTGYVDRVGVMTERQWLNRIVFLETIAGVPGFVAGMARHMRSLRLMRRDNGWIHTLIEEAENERMHLLTFLKLRKPSAAFRAMVLIAQGVFMNVFFACYLFSPKTCHRFVGYLEESAVHTYTLCLKDIEHGKISHWATTPAPDIAIGYWKLAPGATVKDVVAAVRADEATHRDVNHALSNLNADDPNPVA